jgi:peroxiredoxin (alkyl hydroperoxide reductase subunit C)
MAEPAGCARPTGATVSGQMTDAPEETKIASKEVTMKQAFVSKAAPDFQAPAYYRGTFTSVKLSDYQGKWVLVCFYPGDFTYV